MSNEKGKKELTTEEIKERQRDDFWDFDKMLPHKAPTAASRFAPRDTEAVEIDFGEDSGETLSEFAKIPARGSESSIPPMPNITSRASRADASRRARETLAARAHTPGDVYPQMSVPVCAYEPKDSFLKQVSVFRWPAKYNYYERFSSDAERYYNRAAEECPFVPFYAYLPQYANLSPDQLRFYLYWRDSVRHGDYPDTDYSYIFLYVYEIINLPEKIKPEAGLAALCDLWLAYRERFPRLDRYMGEWVCDYCLIYELPAPHEKLAPILSGLMSVLSFKEFFIRRGEACPFTAELCDLLANYNWRQSSYATAEHRPLFEKHLYNAVLGALTKAWGTEEDFSALLGLSEVQQSRVAFAGALCTYNIKRRIDIRYISLSRSYQLRFIITDLYKMAENGIRAHLGIKSRLSASSVPEPLRAFVRQYFEAELPPYKKPQKTAEEKREEREKREAERRRTEEAAYAAYYEPLKAALSTEDALKLEKASWENTAMLVPEEPDEPAEARERQGAKTEEIPAAVVSQDTADEELTMSDDPYKNFVNALNPVYYDALKHIICLEREEYAVLCKTAMLLPDAMAEEINSLAVTYTEDTVIEPWDGFWKLSDFYANEVTDAVVAREEA